MTYISELWVNCTFIFFDNLSEKKTKKRWDSHRNFYLQVMLHQQVLVIELNENS